MSVQKIEWNGELVARLVHCEAGDYMIPPVVFDTEGDVIMGKHVLDAIVESHALTAAPVLRDYTPDKLAELNAYLAWLSEATEAPLRTENQ